MSPPQQNGPVGPHGEPAPPQVPPVQVELNGSQVAGEQQNGPRVLLHGRPTAWQELTSRPPLSGVTPPSVTKWPESIE